MKLELLLLLIAVVTVAELIPNPTPLKNQNATGSAQTGQSASNTSAKSSGGTVANDISTITSLLSQKYNNLLLRPTTPAASTSSAPVANLSNPSNDIKDALMAYHAQLLDYYKKNEPIPGANPSSSSSSESNIDNGQNNTIRGVQNTVKAGDYNSINGNTNTVNGSFNSIQGHNDFVQGSGNVVVSDPQTVADMQKQLEQAIKGNGLISGLLGGNTGNVEKTVQGETVITDKSEKNSNIEKHSTTNTTAVQDPHTNIPSPQKQEQSIPTSQNITDSVLPVQQSIAGEVVPSSQQVPTKSAEIIPKNNATSTTTVNETRSETHVSTNYQQIVIAGITVLLLLLF